MRTSCEWSRRWRRTGMWTSPGRIEHSRGMSMGDTLRSILTRLVAYVTVAIAIGLLFLAGASVYKLMWPRPVVPFSQMSRP